MATKLPYWIDHLNRVPHKYNSAVIPLSNHQFYSELEFGLPRLGFSLDRMLELQTMESMRKMMMIQEEIFKHQVEELHRLYDVQRKRMQELDNGLIKRQVFSKPLATGGAKNSPITEAGHFFHGLITRDDTNEPSNSGSGDNSSSRMSNSYPSGEHKGLKGNFEKNEVEVELTLSIGNRTRNKRSPNESNQVLELCSPSGETNTGDRSTSINKSSSVCQENTRPHWLLPDLSLSRT